MREAALRMPYRPPSGTDMVPDGRHTERHLKSLHWPRVMLVRVKPDPVRSCYGLAGGPPQVFNMSRGPVAAKIRPSTVVRRGQLETRFRTSQVRMAGEWRLSTVQRSAAPSAGDHPPR